MAKSKNARELLKSLEPIALLNEESIRKLADACPVEKIQEGESVFAEGDAARESIYLVSGELGLVTGKDSVDERKLSSDSPEARYPVGDREPRQVTAIARSDIEVIRVDNNLLDEVIAEDQLAACKTSVTEHKARSQSSGGGVSGILDRILGIFSGGKASINKDALIEKFKATPLFQQLPEENVVELFDKMELVNAKAGKVLIRQGEEGDFYYLIASGSAEVTRRAAADSDPVFLAELKEGQGFGEEALVSNAKRNATVTMKTKGTLLLLSKRDFVKLLKEPLLRWVSSVEAQDEIKKGAKWLDVRPSVDYQLSHLPGAISIPLHELRNRVSELDVSIPYVCCCDNGRLSSSAVFLMTQRGYKVFVLRGGLQRLST